MRLTESSRRRIIMVKASDAPDSGHIDGTEEEKKL